MNFGGFNKTITNVVVVILIFAVICSLTFLLFLSAKKIAGVLGEGFNKILQGLWG